MLRPPKEFEEYAKRVACITSAAVGLDHRRVWTESRARDVAYVRRVTWGVLRKAGASHPRIASLWKITHSAIVHSLKLADWDMVEAIASLAGEPPEPWYSWQQVWGGKCPNCRRYPYYVARTGLPQKHTGTHYACPNCHHRWTTEEPLNGKSPARLEGMGTRYHPTVLPNRRSTGREEAAAQDRSEHQARSLPMQCADGQRIAKAKARPEIQRFDWRPSSPRNPGAGGGYIPGSIGCFAG